MTLLFPLFRFALVTPLLEFGRYRRKTTSTLIHLSEKWETTHAVKLSLYSPKDFAPVVFPRDWTAMPSIIVHVLWWLMGGWLWFTFFCKILTRSYLLDASLRHLSSVAIDSGTGECNYHSSQQISFCLNGNSFIFIQWDWHGIQSFEGLRLLLPKLSWNFTSFLINLTWTNSFTMVFPIAQFQIFFNTLMTFLPSLAFMLQEQIWSSNHFNAMVWCQLNRIILF